MRRPRSKLQVSTFPFLAVLLCAMGALLMLLFIMDRRAKIAAQHTISDAVAERKKRTQEEEDARQAEWEKAKNLLHQSLLGQQNELLGDAKSLEQSLLDANKKLTIVQTHHLDLHGKIAGEAKQVASLQLQIAGQRAGLSEVEKKEFKSKAELLEAANELAELERAFQQLRALKERDKPVYSVVPYRGKRGDLRTPIYVECVPAGVIFHPEKKLLESWNFSADSLRVEVERRTGTLAMEKTSKEKSREAPEERKGPYVLFLIRPDGIANYYKAQSALKGYQLDFGYELVDEDWVLDFSSESPTRPTAPFNVAKVSTPPKTGSVPAFPGFNGGGTGQGGPPGSPGGIAGGSPSPGGIGNPGGIAGGSSTPGGIGNPGGIAGPPGLGNPAFGGVDTGIPARGSAFVPIGRLAPPIPVASSGPGNSTLPFSGGPVPTPRADLIAPLGNPNQRTPGGIGSGGPAPTPRSDLIAPLGNPNQRTPGGVGGTVPDALGPLPNANNPSPGGIGTGGASPIPRTDVVGPLAKSDGPSPGGVRTGNEATPNEPNPFAAQKKGASNGGEPGLPAPSMPIPGNNVGGKANGSQGGSGEGSEGEPGVPPLPGFGSGPAKKPAPVSPLSKLLGNRDFVITIECYGDHATVTPSGVQYRWTAANAQATDREVVQAVTTLISRRQASVRPGEPPYRPVIRFQVSADGLRSYLRVYPLLEHLRVPMTRENVEE